MRRGAFLLVLGGLASCATLNTTGMTPACERLYNTCLNTCPKAPAPQPGQLQQVYPETAACTQRCNDQASTCK